MLLPPITVSLTYPPLLWSRWSGRSTAALLRRLLRRRLPLGGRLALRRARLRGRGGLLLRRTLVARRGTLLLRHGGLACGPGLGDLLLSSLPRLADGLLRLP